MELIKIGELARRSGVPIATLKHYLREGLIAPARKSGRTMAWYDAELASRVRAIKRLQQDRFLPLDVIRETIERNHAAPDDLTAAEAIAGVLDTHAGTTRKRTRTELIERGVSAEELDWLERAGLAVPRGADRHYSGDDLALLVTLGNARAAGLSPTMLPFELIGDYLKAVHALVEVELRAFRAGVVKRAPARELRALTETATQLSERLVVLVRRKLLLPTLQRLIEETHDHASRAHDRPRSRRVRQPHGASGRPRRTSR